MKNLTNIRIIFSFLFISILIGFLGCAGSSSTLQSESKLLQGSKNTLTLPNGNVVWDLNGEWDFSGENYGVWLAAGGYGGVIKITQSGSSFVGIRMTGTQTMTKGTEAIRGELDKSGFKWVQLITSMGSLNPSGKISKDGNKMIIDDGTQTRVTYTRK